MIKRICSDMFYNFFTVFGDDHINDTIKWPTLKPEWSYCYDFTWLGPSYDNLTRYNGTCSEYLDDTRAQGVPCAPPIVISCKLHNSFIFLLN